jgi:hypothetical protein
MILAKEISTLTTLDSKQLTKILDDSGYYDCDFESVKFLGISNSNQFCYHVTFYDISCNDDEEGEGIVSVTKTTTGELTAFFY